MKQNLNKNAVKRALALFAIGILLTMSAVGQLPTAQTIAGQMKVGWNLGNTLEAICGETAWGNPTATQTLINAVKSSGFNTVRIPVSWDCHSSGNVIDAAWLTRVKAVVDYCMNANMYVIINIHWDNGWLENNVTTSAQASVNVKQQAYWTQIANYFKAYNERVLFASANEPNVSDATGMSVLLSYHQTFINAVRATGGNNSSRTLIIQGPSTDIEKTNTLMNTMPTDQIANRLMVEVHYYTPWNFCGMTADESWGSMFYYWGSGYHSTTDASRNATWGEESDVERYFGYMKSKFVDRGYPVILGEFGAIKRSNPSDLSTHLASRQYYNKYVVSSAVNKGMIPIYWDNGASDFGLFNRSTGAITDQGVITAIMQGAGGSTNVPVTGVTMSPTSASITAGATRQLTATVAPSNATNKTVSWSTSNSSVATVNSSGLVTGVAAGSATITVTTADGGRTATCAFTVTGSSCTPTAITAYIQVNGGAWQQTSSVTVSSGATVKFGPQPVSGGSWSWAGLASGTSREVTIYPTASGTATATYTNTSGCNSTQVFTITVSGSSTVPVTGVTMSPTSASITAGSTRQLTATVAPSNATNKTVSWSTSNSSVATVNSSGLVTGVAAGSATITVTTADGGRTATCAVTVTGSSSSITLTIQENTNGFCSVDGTVDSNNAGYTGSGFANTTNATNSGISWSVSIPSTGTYTLKWRFASTGSRPARLLVNGTSVVSSIAFASTGSWTTWTESGSTSVSLAAGTRVIRLEATGSSGLANIDYMSITGISPAAVACVGVKSALAERASFNEPGGMRLSPNPLKGGTLQIKAGINESSDVNVFVYNALGKVVFKKNFGTNEAGVFEQTLELGNLRKGSYILRLQAGTSIQSKLLLIQ